jgi:hypothetical protein
MDRLAKRLVEAVPGRGRPVSGRPHGAVRVGAGGGGARDRRRAPHLSAQDLAGLKEALFEYEMAKGDWSKAR